MAIPKLSCNFSVRPNCGWELAVVVFCSGMLLGFITTYCIAVYNEHVIPDFPYISDTGGYPPESCLFTLILSIGSCIMFLIIVVRWKYINHHFLQLSRLLGVLNHITLVTGAISVFGMILVGSFQATQVFPVHMFGAVLAFGGGLVFAALNTAITLLLVRRGLDSRHRLAVQALLVALGGLAFGIAFIVGGMATAHKPVYKDPYLQPYHVYYVTSSVAEWLMAILLMFYYLTFYNEFKQVKVGFKAVRTDLEDSELAGLLP